MKDLIRYSLLIIAFYFTSEQHLHAQEKTGGERVTIKEEKPTNSSSYRGGSSGPLKETTSSSFNNEEVIKEIKAQLATMATKPLMELIEFCKKNTIQGEFVIDLTIEGKGKVLTVFMVSGGEDNIPKKNLLKNKLVELQFENIKIPKKERVKLRYTLNF